MKDIPPQLKQEVIAGLRILCRRGLMEDNSGHVSARFGDTRYFVVVGHLHDKGWLLEEVGEEHLVVVDAETEEWKGPIGPPEEYYLHSAIYRRRPDVGGIVHAHPFAPVALSAADRPVLPVHHWASPFYPQVPVYPRFWQICSRERGEELAESLGEGYGVVLRGHGIVAVGSDVRAAVVHAVILDRCARIQLACQGLGEVKPLPFEKREPISRSRVEKLWSYEMSLLNRRESVKEV